MSTVEHSPDRDPLVGHVLGEAYRLVRLIGRGGMGAVYEASHVRLPKRFAVKILRGGLTADKDSFARFQREAQVASSLGNRHIAHVLDFSTMSDGTPYMVLEYLQGEDLAHRIKTKGRLAPREAVDVCGQVASALAAAHRQGIIHRDVKPENIFLCRSEEDGVMVKLLDFGLSKVRNPEAPLTQSAAFLGTPAYMSPEQANGELTSVDLRTDVYALGAVMYEALAGVPPFEGASVYALLLKIIHEPPASLLTRTPSLPPAVDTVVQRALAKDPAHRYSSAREFYHALRRSFRQHKDEKARFENEPTEPACRSDSKDGEDDGPAEERQFSAEVTNTGIVAVARSRHGSWRSMRFLGPVMIALVITIIALYVMKLRSGPADPSSTVDLGAATRVRSSERASFHAAPPPASAPALEPHSPKLRPHGLAQRQLAAPAKKQLDVAPSKRSHRAQRVRQKESPSAIGGEPILVKGSDL